MRVHRVVAPVRQFVVDQLREAVIKQKFLPSQRLTERELTELTGVSRPTVREALQQLAAEGLVTTVPGKGWVVTALTAEEAADLYAVRALIEGLTGRRFVERATDLRVAELKAAFEMLERIFVRTAPISTMMDAKNHFYNVLFAGANSETIVSIIAGLHARVSVLRARSLSHPGRPAESVEELRAIVEAVIARDAQRAAWACTFHVEQAARVALRDMTESTMDYVDSPSASLGPAAEGRHTSMGGATVP